jgi:hypothetical protein
MPPRQKPKAAQKPRALQRDKYALKNLKFLGDFLSAMNLTTTTAGEKAGVSQVTVYYWLKKDDAHLSSVENLINACGYRLTFDFVPLETEETPADISIELASERRLSFIARNINGIDKEELARKLGVGGTTVYYWLSHDDIFISYIYRIADAIGKRVKISIRPL